MNDQRPLFGKGKQFVAYFALASGCAVAAYLCRFHVYGLDESGYIYWKFLFLTIAMVFWIMIRLLFVFKE